MTVNNTNFEKTWEYFQGNLAQQHVFDGSRPRYLFLARRIPATATVLNIGVGAGGLEEILGAKCKSVYSLDPGEAAITALRARLGMGDRAQVGYSQSMPFANAMFDHVVMTEVLEHLEPDVLRQTLLELRRVLKPRGTFLGTVPANESLRDNTCFCPACGTTFHRWGHISSFSKQSLSALLSEAGFQVRLVEARAFPDWERKGFAAAVKSTSRHLLGRFGAQIAGPCIFFSAISPMGLTKSTS